MSLRVAVGGEANRVDAGTRSEGEPEEGVFQSPGADAKPCDLHLARVKSR